VEPASRVRRLGPPSSLAVNRVHRLLVQEGDQAAAGQLLAEFADAPLKDAAVLEASAAVAEAEASLARVRAAARPSEIDASRHALSAWPPSRTLRGVTRPARPKGAMMDVQSLREKIFRTDNQFSVIVADTPELVHAACRLRYQVYCVERGFEPESNGIETDEFDAYARHVLLIHRQSGEIIGTVRVVPPRRSSFDATLPMQRVCQPGLLRDLPLRTTGEVSRFAVSKQRRMSLGATAMVRLSLMQGIVNVSDQLGLTPLVWHHGTVSASAVADERDPLHFRCAAGRIPWITPALLRGYSDSARPDTA
jgi:predicted GNAT family N-acyltransferase